MSRANFEGLVREALETFENRLALPLEDEIETLEDFVKSQSSYLYTLEALVGNETRFAQFAKEVITADSLLFDAHALSQEDFKFFSELQSDERKSAAAGGIFKDNN